jgi:hypothetical protein
MSWNEGGKWGSVTLLREQDNRVFFYVAAYLGPWIGRLRVYRNRFGWHFEREADIYHPVIQSW